MSVYRIAKKNGKKIILNEISGKRLPKHEEEIILAVYEEAEMEELMEELLEFIKTISGLVRGGTMRIERVLDIVYDRMDGLTGRGEYEKIDFIFKSLDPAELHTDIILGLFASTALHAKNLNPQIRKIFLDKAEIEIKNRGEWESFLLGGLE